MEYSVVIVAAGKGSRMGLGYNKVYYKIDGVTILERTMSIFLHDEDCKQIVVVTDSDDYRKYMDPIDNGKIVLANGGDTRQESVAHGLEAVLCDRVLIHDGARPYLKEESLEDIKLALETNDAVCLMVPSKDTMKIVKDGYIQETVNRETIWAAQTPQAFRTSLILDCMHKAIEEDYQVTDDCMLVEHYTDTKVKVIQGEYGNIKITTLDDVNA